MVTYFLDAYAMVAILEGHPAYSPYAEGSFATNRLHLYELHYHELRARDRTKAFEALRLFGPFEQRIEDDDIAAASAFRLANRRKRFSYADALGYQMAVRRGMRFLTGDRAFRGMRHVEFVR